MYAIVSAGGKQYKVENGTVFKVELMKAEVGQKVELPVLFVSENGEVKAGKDVANATVTAEVTYIGRGPKIDIFTYKAKKNVRKRQGHRQPYTELKVLEIKA